MAWMPTRTGQRRSAQATLSNPKPLARSEDLVIEELPDELLVYDRATNRAHCLGDKAVRVWRACDGYTTVAVLANKLDLEPDTVALALGELEDCGLLVASPQPNGSTRREFSMRTAKLGAAAASVPLIISMGIPEGAAATPTPAQCQLYNNTSCNGCSGICGCCCCCRSSAGQNTASCKLCYPINLCPTFRFSSNVTGPNCGSLISQAPACSVEDKKNCTPPDPNFTGGCVYNGGA